MAYFIPMNDTPSSPDMAEVFYEEVVRLHGVPDEILSDNGCGSAIYFGRRNFRSTPHNQQSIILKQMGKLKE